MRRLNSAPRRGDTMIEVLFAIAVFALISVLSVIVMNSGVATVESTLELSMARNEIDAQSEVLRFIHNSFLSERDIMKGNRQYENIWKVLKAAATANAADSNAILPLTLSDLNPSECSGRYEASSPKSIYSSKSIILNTRKIDTDHPDRTIISAKPDNDIFRPAALNPRVIFNSGTNSNEDEMYESTKYTNVAHVEGIWVIPVESEARGLDDNGYASDKPEFYDFHIYTCWNAPGRTRPTTIGTIMQIGRAHV